MQPAKSTLPDSVFSSLDGFATRLGLPAGIAPRIIETLILILVVVLVARLLRRMLARAVDDETTLRMATGSINYTSGFIVLLITARIWLSDLGGVATYLGLASAGLAISLRDPVANFFGWLVVVWRRPYETGDRVEVESHRGDVLSIHIFVTKLREVGNRSGYEQPTGRIVSFPNSYVFNRPLARYHLTGARRWTEVSVVVAFESDTAEAESILENVLAEETPQLEARDLKELKVAAKEHFDPLGPTKPTLWTELEERGIKYTLRFLCPAREQRLWVTRVTRAMLRAIAASEGVRVAVPTMRLMADMPEMRASAGERSSES